MKPFPLAPILAPAMNMERPSSPKESPKSQSPRKRTLLDKVFRYLPAGSRNIAGALALGAMEAISDNPEQVDALKQADDMIQEQKKDQIKSKMQTEEAALQEEKLDEIRKKIRNG